MDCYHQRTQQSPHRYLLETSLSKLVRRKESREPKTYIHSLTNPTKTKQAFGQILNHPDTLEANCALKISCLNITSLLTNEFPSQMKKHISVLLPGIWASLVNGVHL
jgi:hypothetical protein